MANFIWGGVKEKRKYHLTNLKNITLPKKMGGWGIMHLRSFGMALFCKSLWRAVFGDSLWSTAMKIKYLGNKDISFWYKNILLGSCQGSAIWRSFKKVSQFFLKRLIWKLHTGNNILIGFDPILEYRQIPLSPNNSSCLYIRKACSIGHKSYMDGRDLFLFGNRP